MNVIDVSVPEGKGEAVARVALDVGISEASVQQVYVHGLNKNKELVQVQVATPQARAFVDALMSQSYFNPNDYSIVSDEVPAIVSSDSPAEITRPFQRATMDVFEGLWMRVHITPSYLARATVSALLLAYGMIENDLLTMVAALLFTPFLEPLLAVSFGLMIQEWRLARQGALVFATSMSITLVAGALVAAMTGGPLQFDQFSPLLVSFLISLIVGFVSGLATADMVANRELIAFAAAAQFAIYPAWFGVMLVLGLPDAATVTQRLLSFVVNTITVLVVAVAVYAVLKYRPEVIKRYSEAVPETSS